MARRGKGAFAVRLLAIRGVPAARQGKEAVHCAGPRAFHLHLVAHGFLAVGSQAGDEWISKKTLHNLMVEYQLALNPNGF